MSTIGSISYAFMGPGQLTITGSRPRHADSDKKLSVWCKGTVSQRVAAVVSSPVAGLLGISKSSNVHAIFGLGSAVELDTDSTSSVTYHIGSNHDDPTAVKPVGVPTTAFHNRVGILPGHLIDTTVREHFLVFELFQQSDLTGDLTFLVAHLPTGGSADTKYAIAVIPATLLIFFGDAVAPGPVDENLKAALDDNYPGILGEAWLYGHDHFKGPAAEAIIQNSTKLKTKNLFSMPDKVRRPLLTTPTPATNFHRFSEEEEVALSDDLKELDNRIRQYLPGSSSTPPGTIGGSSTSVAHSTFGRKSRHKNRDDSDESEDDEGLDDSAEREARRVIFQGNVRNGNFTPCSVNPAYGRLANTRRSKAAFNKLYKELYTQTSNLLGLRGKLDNVDPPIQFPAVVALYASSTVRTNRLTRLSDGNSTDGANVAFEIPIITDNTAADNTWNANKTVDIEVLLGESPKNQSKMSKTISVNESVRDFDSLMTMLDNIHLRQAVSNDYHGDVPSILSECCDKLKETLSVLKTRRYLRRTIPTERGAHIPYTLITFFDGVYSLLGEHNSSFENIMAAHEGRFVDIPTQPYETIHKRCDELIADIQNMVSGGKSLETTLLYENSKDVAAAKAAALAAKPAAHGPPNPRKSPANGLTGKRNQPGSPGESDDLFTFTSNERYAPMPVIPGSSKEPCGAFYREGKLCRLLSCSRDHTKITDMTPAVKKTWCQHIAATKGMDFTAKARQIFMGELDLSQPAGKKAKTAEPETK